jgi:hypothetical protein
LKSIDVSIIIVNYNTRKYLGSCIRSISDAVGELNYEVIVVDNNSNDGSVGFIQKKFPKIKLLVNAENIGYARANNQGLKLACGNFVLLLNPDTVILDNAIQKMIDHATKNSDVGIIGCRVLNPGNKLQWDSCGSYLTLLTLFFREVGLEKLFSRCHFFDQRLMRCWQRDYSRSIDWVSGVCMLVRREIIGEIGALDERYFAYIEDMDFCRRAQQRGWKIFFLHNAEILHDSAASWRKSPGKHLFTSLMSERAYIEKHYGKPGVTLFRLSHLFGSYVRYFINLFFDNRRKARDHYRILHWLIRWKT